MQVVNDYSHTIIDTLKSVTSIDVFINGKVIKYNKDTERFNDIYRKLNEKLSNARVDPAFGVSLHDETIKQIQSGTWLKLNFDKTMEKNGLPFDALLFQLEDGYGINLIREYKGRYEGRCIYLNFFDNIALKDLIKNN